MTSQTRVFGRLLQRLLPSVGDGPQSHLPELQAAFRQTQAAYFDALNRNEKLQEHYESALAQTQAALKETQGALAQTQSALKETQDGFYSTQRLYFEAQEQVALRDEAINETQRAFYSTQRLYFEAQEQVALRDEAIKETQGALYRTQEMLFDTQEQVRRQQLALRDAGRPSPAPRRARDLTPSIVFNAVPKSASYFITQTLAAGLGYDNVELCLNIFPGATIDHQAADLFVKGDCICHHHMEATDINLWYLQRYRMPLTLHVRDLRSVMISWVHHLGDAKTEAAMGGHPLIAPTQEFFERSLEWQLDWALETQLPVYIAFIDGWVKAHDSGEVKLLITSYEHFLRDSDGFFGQVLDFFEIPRSRFKNPNLDKTRSLNFRAGDPNEWRRVMTADQIAKCTRAIPDNWWSRFGWQAPD